MKSKTFVGWGTIPFEGVIIVFFLSSCLRFNGIYYEMSGQMKTLIDRMNAMYPQDYKFRDVYLLTTAADDDEQTPKRAETGLGGWIECFPESRLAGTLFCGGVNAAGEIDGNAKLQDAFEMGKNIQ